MIWRESLIFVNGHLRRPDFKVRRWVLVGQCPGVRHQAIHKIWDSDGFIIGQDNMLPKRTPTLSGNSYLAHQSGHFHKLKKLLAARGKLPESPTPCFRRVGKHYSVAQESRVHLFSGIG